MTAPAPWKRSTAKQRRANRERFRQLKAECAAKPSREILKRRAKGRRDADRARAQQKVKGALAGETIRPFSALEIARVRPAEHEHLREEVSNRLAALTAEERKGVNAAQHLC